MNCYIALRSPDQRESTTIPAGDHRSLARRRSQGWAVDRIFRASLPWPAGQRLTCCAHGHAEFLTGQNEQEARP